MKSRLLITLLCIFGSTQLAKAHSVQIQYCVSCAGDLRIWVEHWHGAASPASTSMTITVDTGTGPVTYNSAPGGGVQNIPSGSLPGCSTPLIYGAGCPGNENTYNDWVYYDFLGLPTNQNIIVTIVSGNTVFTEDGCGMFPLSFNFVISGVALGNDQYICDGSTTAPISFPPTATWTNSNPGIGLAAAGVGSIPSFNPVGAPGTTATINYNNNCGSGSFDIIIQENPTPTFIIGNGGAGQDTVCFGTPLVFSDASTIPPPNTITNWDWDWGDGSTHGTLQNETHTYALPGDYSVILEATSDSGCVAATFAVPVHVAPIPVAAFISDTVCANTPTTLTDGSTVGSGTINNWDWDILNDGSVDNTNQGPIQNTFTAGGTYSVELTVSSNVGCTNSIVNDVLVDYIPNPDFISDSVCLGNATTFADNSTISAGTITGIDWDFGLGTATGTPTSYTFLTAGNNNVTLTTTSDQGCTASTTLPAYVRELPIADFTVNDECFYNSVLPVNNSSISIGTMTYEWDFGDVTPLDLNPNPSHLYNTSGTYNISLTATSNFGCIDAVTLPIIAHTKPTASFVVTDECISFPNAYTDQSANPGAINGDAITNWQWDVNSNATIDYNTQNPNHSFSSEGVFTTDLIVTTTFGCSDTISGPVTVYPKPYVDFTFGDLCFGDSTAFEQLSTISNAFTVNTINTFNWTFAGTHFDSGPSVKHEFSSHGNKAVNLQTISNHGCIHDTTIMVDIKALPIADFNSTTICENTPPTTFGDDSDIIPGYGNINDWKWDFGDGGTSFTQATSHNYGTAGIYNTTLVVTTTDGCIDSITKPVTVLEKPTANFSTNTFQVCSPDTIIFTDLSSSANGTIDLWRWDFFNGGGSIDQNPIAYYTASGPNPDLYDVELIVGNNFGCYDTLVYNDYIEVFPTPEAEFEIDQFELLITDTEAAFTNKTVNGHTYDWDFGDGSPNVSEEHPTHLFPFQEAGTYEILLTAHNFGGMCTDTYLQQIEVVDILIFHVPNIFTPDGDDYNEIWQPVFFSGYDPFDFHLMVFNRNGEIIWESFDASVGWNGHYGNGGLVEDGVYVWSIDFKETKSDKRHKHNGHVTVLK
ncbi:MAG: PKD domain-containing protein [Crocinitomicaceae bacterium]|nr:PKD domain-containing protein [Crocinitomicaceae bacterium]